MTTKLQAGLFITQLLFMLLALSARACDKGGTWGLGKRSNLRVAKSGGLCGVGLAICPENECCSAMGVCGKSAEHCNVLCQCEVSGKKSKCNGALKPEIQIPTAASGAVCGDQVARCPKMECCSVLGICTTSPYVCSMGKCSYMASGEGSPCKKSQTNASSPSNLKKFTLKLTWGQRAPDGFTRKVILINGMFPGPLINVTVGDRVVVKVINELEERASIHWHGLVMHNTVIMDGVSEVTQIPMQAGTTQVYSFQASHPGLYWYHSHFKAQYMDGLRGNLVIMPDPSDTFAPVLDVVNNAPPLLFSDWYHQLSNPLIKKYLSGEPDELFPGSEPGDEPVPQTAIINAHGQGKCTGLKCKYTVVKATHEPVSTPVNHSCGVDTATTALQLVNGAGFAKFIVSVDEHFMSVVAQDAVTYKPSEPLPLVIFSPGQRITVLLCPATEEAAAKALAGESFWIRGYMWQPVFPIPAEYPMVLGIVTYGDDMGPIMKKLPNSTSWNETDPTTEEEVLQILSDFGTEAYPLQPLGLPTPPPATVNFTFDVVLTQVNGTGTSWAYFNGISMHVDPEGPSLLQQKLEGTLGPNENMGPNVIWVQKGDVVQFIFNNRDGGYHPFHLHGHWMWVMARGNTGDGDYNGQPLDETPILRDTMVVFPESYLVVRFMADNPGMWILHCHIDWHLVDGLAFVVGYGV